MPLSLYNSFSKRNELFTPLTPGVVTMYTCGPTVYGRPHIGNYSSFLMADLLRRWLEVGHGLTVQHVKNITDVGHLVADADDGEDKIEREARKEKIDPLAVAARFTEMYLNDESALHLLEPHNRPRASAFVKEMLSIIRTLTARGHTYETEDGVYFRVESFSRYGMLSGNTLENINAGARISVDEKKEHPADFALWKKCVGHNAQHILRWSFATGDRVHTIGEDTSAGFPGWHIECSAMSSSLLGQQIDIHTGGEDNIFPHHECEIAQSECAYQKAFVRYWLHKRRIDLQGEKMSKSLGNVLSIDDIIAKGYSPLDFRYAVLTVHYRTNMKFSWDSMKTARSARCSILEWINSMQSAQQSSHPGSSDTSFIAACHQKFIDCMNHDLNTSGAIAAVFECMNSLRSSNVLNAQMKQVLDPFIAMIKHTFGCFNEEVIPEQTLEIPLNVQALLEERKCARASKNFTRSDELRDEILTLGFVIDDQKSGEQKVSARLG